MSMIISKSTPFNLINISKNNLKKKKKGESETAVIGNSRSGYGHLTALLTSQKS